MNVVGEIQLLSLALLLSTATGALLAHAVTKVLLPRVLAWSPAERHRGLWLLSASPALLSLLLLGAAVLPTLLALVVPELDHCAHHDDDHPHLCFVHLPHDAGSIVVWLVLATMSSGALIAASRFALRLVESTRIATQLLAASDQRAARGFAVVPSDQTLCLAVGLWAPTIAISDALLAQLDEAGLSVLLAHERAHQRRRDAAWQLAAHALSVLHTPTMRRALLSELNLAAEETCDAAAARHVGDALTVASTIVRVAKLGPHALDLPTVAAFDGSATERRVMTLLEPSGSTVGPRAAAFWGACALASAALLAASPVWHHAVESTLAILYW